MKYRELYIREDDSITVNDDDEDLFPIVIPLPKLDEWYTEQIGRTVDYEEAITFVDGYGLHPDDQVFKHQIVPDKIRDIYEITFSKLAGKKGSKYKEITDVEQEDIFRELENNQEHYKDEIIWIKKQIKRRFVGYWCFIKGKPTFINGPFYYFLNFWKLKNKNRKDSLPDYRNYQRIMFSGMLYAHTTDDLFFLHRVVYRNQKQEVIEKCFNDWESVLDFENNLKAAGISFFHQKNVTGGIFRKSEGGARTCNGVNFISGRRIAKTDSACCFGMWCNTNLPEQLFAIQGLNKEQAVEKVFVQKIQVPFNKLPFFFRPYVKGKDDSKNGLNFFYDSEMALMHKAGVVPDPLGGRVTPFSSNERATDGEEVNFAYIDEPAKELDKKSQERDIPSLWYEVLKPATEIGSEIVGTTIMPTTVGDMESGGGDQFLRIVNDSMFHERNDNGTTPSGLITIFMNGYYAIPGFIDKWGDTVMETPEKPVISNTGKIIGVGAKEWHENQIREFERKKQWDKINTHNRNYPPSFKAAFQLNMKGMGMTEQTLQKMKERVSDLRFSKDRKTSKIDFAWIGKTENVQTDINSVGLWTYSYLPPLEHWNKKTVVTEEDGYTSLGQKVTMYAPHTSIANKFIICFDPVKYDKMNVRGKRSSTPAAAVYYKRDVTLDPDGKPREEWVSQDYVAFIRHKTDSREEIYEEILKAAILYGAYIYPESNDANDFFQWIRRRGYDAYLLRDMDEKGKMANVPGVSATATSIQDMVTKMADYFNHNVRYMKIAEIIEDWLKMRGVDDLTNRDLAAATGWCQVADAQRTGAFLKSMTDMPEIVDSFDAF